MVNWKKLNKELNDALDKAYKDTCPPKSGSCPYMYYVFKEGEVRNCIVCGKTVRNNSISF